MVHVELHPARLGVEKVRNHGYIVAHAEDKWWVEDERWCCVQDESCKRWSGKDGDQKWIRVQLNRYIRAYFVCDCFYLFVFVCSYTVTYDNYIFEFLYTRLFYTWNASRGNDPTEFLKFTVHCW